MIKVSPSVSPFFILFPEHYNGLTTTSIKSKRKMYISQVDNKSFPIQAALSFD